MVTPAKREVSGSSSLLLHFGAVKTGNNNYLIKIRYTRGRLRKRVCNGFCKYYVKTVKLKLSKVRPNSLLSSRDEPNVSVDSNVNVSMFTVILGEKTLFYSSYKRNVRYIYMHTLRPYGSTKY